jgi:AcrR family transcriptional regulator
MIRAAHRLFVERGYSGTRMADIAVEAGVAVQTVYFRFNTKTALLQACYELAVLGEEDPRPPQLQPWYQAFLQAGDGAAALRHFAEGNSAIVSRVGVLDDVVRSALHEPEAVAVRAHNEQLRRDGCRVLVEHVQERFGLRAPLTPEMALDVLLALGSVSMYRTLVLDYGWSHSAFVDWLTESLAGLLLPAA